ncbi:hypothetical protein DFQ30_010755 [Apophysomyces sp. BC1015]|nr:hypothetical protein DFQ30_010755 [Apophysomyces sp. BC1015]
MTGIRDVLVISTPDDTPRFEAMLGDGGQWGMNIQYAVQPSPDGLAQAFIIGRDFIGNDPSALILGDNIFYGHDLVKQLEHANARQDGATVLAYHVNDPERYGVVEFDSEFRALSIEEKPTKPRSHYVVTGLYFYDNNVCDIAASIRPSARGELEITDVNCVYLDAGKLNVGIMGRGFAWLDTGTHDSLIEAATFIATLQKRQGLVVACPEEVAYRLGWIDAEQLRKLAAPLAKSQYGKYLQTILTDPVVWQSRGFFFESFNARDFAQCVDGSAVFVQDNHSCSARGVLRGLHYQIEHAQGKLVRVVHGEVFDVAVDIRRSSPSFGQWVGVHLSAANRRQLWVPAGFAHGFLTLSDNAEFLYKTTDYRFPEFERSILWNDRELGIEWPLQGDPVVAAKDAVGKPLGEAELYA